MARRATILTVTLAVTAVLLAALGWGLLSASSMSAFQVVGKASPDVRIQGFDGAAYDLAAMRGMPVVLNFWASWCVPCREEAPVLNSAAVEFDNRIRFLGADIQDSDAAGRQYVKDLSVPYPAGPLVRGSYRDFGVTKPPETLFIDRNGTVVAKFIGPLTEHLLHIYISQLKP